MLNILWGNLKILQTPLIFIHRVCCAKINIYGIYIMSVKALLELKTIVGGIATYIKVIKNV
jgi:hypothetical protein